MIKDRVAVSWSGGKDSTMALYYIVKQKKYEVAYLLTTITEGFERVTMHGVRR
jgi:diphthamide synthase (EF-2-diphthine--ammonia ligase)